MIVTMERLNEILDDIASGRSKPMSLSQVAQTTGQPTTLIRIRAVERGLVVERDTIRPAAPS